MVRFMVNWRNNPSIHQVLNAFSQNRVICEISRNFMITYI